MKIKTLLLPQVTLLVIGFIKPISMFFITKSALDINLLNPFAWNLWFLPVLFICSIVYMLLSMIIDMDKCKNKWLLLLIIIVTIPLSIWANKFGLEGLPHCMQIVPTAMAFYLIGNIMKSFVINLDKSKTLKKSILAFIAISVCFTLSVMNTPVLMYANEYGKYPLFFICSILGCFFTIYISMFIKESRLLAYVGTKSIAFYVWQGIIASLSLSVSYRFVNGVLHITNTNVVSLLALSIALVALSIIVSFSISICPQIYGMRRHSI